MIGMTVDIQIIDTMMTAIIDMISIGGISDTVGLMLNIDAMTDTAIATKNTTVTVKIIDATVPGIKRVRISGNFGSAKHLSQEFGGTFRRISANSRFFFGHL